MPLRLAALLLLLAGPASARWLEVYTGVVVDAEKRPVPGARVGGCDTSGELVTAVTAATGRFRLTADYLPLLLATASGHGCGYAYTDSCEVTIWLAPEPVAVSGRATTADGRGVAGARVDLISLQPEGATPLQRPAAEGFTEEDEAPSLVSTTTGPEGEFTLTDLPFGHTVGVAVTAAGLARATAFARTGEPLVVDLEPEAVISGRVVRGGRGLAGVALGAQRQQPETTDETEGGSEADKGPSCYHALSDAQGNYSLRSLPAGTYHLWVTKPLPSGLADAAVRAVTVAAGQQLPGVEVRVVPGGLLAGKVSGYLTPDDYRFTNVRVVPAGASTQADAVYTVADAAGRYELALPPGRYEVSAEPYNADWYAPQPAAGTEVRAGATATVNLALRPARRIHGTVLTPQGKPAAGVEVRLYAPDAESPVLRTGPGGGFLFPPTHWPAPEDADDELWPAVWACDRARGWCAFVPVPRDHREVRVRLQAGLFTEVQVVDEAGAPLGGVALTVAACLADQGCSHTLAEPASDAGGVVRLGPLPAGQTLQVSAPDDLAHLLVGEDWLDPQELTLSPGRATALPRLRLQRGRGLRVTVQDEQGRPVPGALVSVQPLATRPTGPDGQAAIEHLPPAGDVLVLAMHPELAHYAGLLLDPQAGQAVTLTLRTLGRATGEACDEDGQPLRGAAVLVYCPYYNDEPPDPDDEVLAALEDDCLERSVVTDTEGRWHAQLLVPGLHYVVGVSEEEGEVVGVLAEFTAHGGPQEQLVPSPGRLRMDQARGVPAGPLLAHRQWRLLRRPPGPA